MKRITVCISLALLLCGYVNASDICIAEICISGNKTTKGFIIQRELPFQVGDVLTEDELVNKIEKATSHLTNTRLFNFVDISYISDSLAREDCLTCKVTVHVDERWYYVPEFRFNTEDRNFSSWLKEKDIKRVTIGWGLRNDNVFGLRHTLSVNHMFGYRHGFRLSYSKIALDKNRTKMLGFSVVSSNNKTMNIISENDKVIYMKDPNNYLEKTFQGAINYTYRPGFRNSHILNIGYQKVRLQDTILKMNQHYWGTQRLVNDIYTASYIYDHEHRDYNAYPTKGYYIGSELKVAAADRFNFFYSYMNLKLQYFKEFYPRWFWSSRINAGASFKNKRAYIYDQYVGYEDKNLTGYDYYVVDGQHFSILNNDIRYCLMTKRIVNLSSSDSAKEFTKMHFTLYAKLAFDIGYVHDKYRPPTNTLANTFLWGSGLGLDLVTYYDIILSCSYAINKMGEGAFFFGIKAPIF